MILVDPEDRPPLDVDPSLGAVALAKESPDRLFIATPRDKSYPNHPPSGATVPPKPG